MYHFRVNLTLALTSALVKNKKNLECGHVANQIKGNELHNNMQEIVCPEVGTKSSSFKKCIIS